MMKNKLTKLIFATLISFATMGFIMPVAAQQKPVTIGIPLPLSGNFNEFGMMMKNSFEMAQEAVNKSGGINGRSLEILFADDKGDVAFVQPAFDKLVGTSKPVMLVGGYASDPTYRLARMAEDAACLFSFAPLRLTKSPNEVGKTFTGSTHRSANIPKDWKISG